MIDTACLATALSDRYTIAHELGAGGMTFVYLAKDKKLNAGIRRVVQ